MSLITTSIQNSRKNNLDIVDPMEYYKTLKLNKHELHVSPRICLLCTALNEECKFQNYRCYYNILYSIAKTSNQIGLYKYVINS